MARASSGRDRSKAAPGARALRIALVLLAFASAGCERLAPRSEASAGDALWLTSESVELDRAALDALERVGVEQLFVEGATLDWNAQGRPVLVREELQRLPPRTRITLATSGDWPSADPAVGEAVQTLATELRSLQLEAEGTGALVAGHHLVLRVPEDQLESYRRFVERLRRMLDRGLLLSVEVPSDWLDREDLGPLLDAVDFFTVRIYGQSPEAADRAERWELETALEIAARAERRGRPFLTAIGLLGRAVRTGDDGEAVALLRGLPLAELVGNEALVVEPGFRFEGFHRETFTIAARGPAITRGVPMAAGDTLTVSRPTVYHLVALEQALDRAAHRHRLGSLFVRLPGRRETLSLQLPDLVAALESSDEMPAPELRPWAEVLSRGGRWRLRAGVANTGTLPTGVAVVDSNYLEIRLDGGTFGAVEPGGFRRMELRRSDRDTFDMRTLRNADVLRLFYPLLEAGWQVESGTIEVHPAGGAPSIRAGARFQLPDGRSLEVEPLPLEERSRPATDDGEVGE